MSFKNIVCCYFCDQRFDTEAQLIAHQKSKHFRCPECNRVKSSVENLNYHISSVHKKLLTQVPNSIEGRGDPNNNIFGMKGIPEDVYVKWLMEIDPAFKESSKNLDINGSYVASQATQIAAQMSSQNASSIIYDTFNQFQNATVQIVPLSDSIITAKGIISSENLRKVKVPAPDQLQTIQRRYEASVRAAKTAISDAEKATDKLRRKEAKERRKNEILYFKPDGEEHSNIEMRAMAWKSQK